MENIRDRMTADHDDVNEGVNGNLSQMRAKLPKVGSNNGFIFGSANNGPSASDSAKHESNSNYSETGGTAGMDGHEDY